MGLLHGGSVITAGPSATRAVAAATLGPSMSLTMREGGAVWLRPSSLPRPPPPYGPTVRVAPLLGFACCLLSALPLCAFNTVKHQICAAR